MKNKSIFLILPAVAIVLEALPYGAVCYFAMPDRESVRKTFSYFDPTPYGYANFGPFLTAICSVALLILGIVFLFRKGRKIAATIRFFSLLATLFSLMPLTFGLRYYPLLAGMITLCHAFLSLTSIKLKG